MRFILIESYYSVTTSAVSYTIIHMKYSNGVCVAIFYYNSSDSICISVKCLYATSELSDCELIISIIESELRF